MGETEDFCTHLDSIGEVTKEDLLLKSKGTCESCGAGGPNLWACLQDGCQSVGCGESYADHSTLHAQTKKHNLTVNLTTFRVWCYSCEKEVFLDPRPPPSSQTTSPRLNHRDFSFPAHPLKFVPIAVADDGESESDDDDIKPRGLTGMKNIGNSCYMNAALQALSNCPPLTQFFLECGGLVRTEKKPALCKSYQKLVSELWHKKRPNYVVPSNLYHGIKLVNPLFRGYSQQDTQEFLRCLMDQLHEELKEPVPCEIHEREEERDDQHEAKQCGTMDEDYLSCDSSGENRDGEGGGGLGSLSEMELLIREEVGRGISEKEKLKEKRMSYCNKRTSSEQADEDADVDTAMIPEPDNDAYMHCSSRPCSPHHLDSFSKHSSTPSHSSPLRTGHSYILKKAHVLSGSKRRPEVRYRSVISDIFDGSILSLVQCLTCDRVSNTIETFQDLSLPIPGKEDLAKLHSTMHQGAVSKTGTCGDSYPSQGWLAFLMDYIRRSLLISLPLYIHDH